MPGGLIRRAVCGYKAQSRPEQHFVLDSPSEGRSASVTTQKYASASTRDYERLLYQPRFMGLYKPRPMRSAHKDPLPRHRSVNLISPRYTSLGEYATLPTDTISPLPPANSVSPRCTSSGRYSTYFELKAEPYPSVPRARLLRSRSFSKPQEPQTVRPIASVHKEQRAPSKVHQATEGLARPKDFCEILT
jgi:hypothetical protein